MAVLFGNGFDATPNPWWDPVNIGLYLQILHNRILLVDTDTGAYSAIGLKPIVSGDKFIFSVKLIFNFDNNNQHYSVGFATHDAYLNDHVGFDQHGIGLLNTGDLLYDNNPIQSGFPSWNNQNDIIDIAISRVSEHIWFRVNGGNWNNRPGADPATNTDGFDISSFNILHNATLYPAITIEGSTGPSEFQLVASPYGIPAGFSIIEDGGRVSEQPNPTPTPTPTPTPAPLSQFTPNGTPGSNGLLTYLNYTNGVDSGNNILLPDSSGFNHPYAWTGTNPYNVGTTGYTFNGTGNWAYASDASNYNLGFNQMSFEMWVKIPSIPGSMSLIAAGGNNSGGWALRLDSSGNALNLVKYNVADQSVSLPSQLQSDTWYHIAALQGGTSLTYMVNGVIVGAINSGDSNNFSFPNGTVNIAKDYYTGTNYAMTLGYLKVYDYCLTSSDVVTEYNNTKSGYGF